VARRKKTRRPAKRIQKRKASTPKKAKAQKAKPAAKKRTKAISGRKTYDRKLTTRAGRDIIAHRTEYRYKRSSYAKKAGSASSREASLAQQFDRHFAPEMRRFFLSQKSKNRGNKYIFRLLTQHNLKGKKIPNGYSNRRTKIRSLKSFNKFIARYKKDFLQSMQKYLARKDMSSISFRGISLEVVRSETKARKSSKTSKAKT